MENFSNNQGKAVESLASKDFSAEGNYKGFGFVKGETVEEFHDRMYNLSPEEAMIYELEFEEMRNPSLPGEDLEK